MTQFSAPKGKNTIGKRKTLNLAQKLQMINDQSSYFLSQDHSKNVRMSLNLPSNPGVGLKLTAPRIPDHPSSSDTHGPGPQSYSIGGMSDLTEREMNQNELLSKRYEPSTGAAMKNNGDPKSYHQFRVTLRELLASSPASPSAGQKRTREQDNSEYYKIPGMSDLTNVN